MESRDFVHLHLHTQYSLLEGAIKIKPLVQKISELGMRSVAMTDTNNLFGAIDFYLAAKAQGIHPILGCDVHYGAEGRFEADQRHSKIVGHRRTNLRPDYFHLTLLCKSLKGYQNLCQIVTQAYLSAPEPKKGVPPSARFLVDQKLLEKYGEGLIVLSGHLRGEVGYRILQQEEKEARKALEWFQKQFRDDFYFEMQDHGLPEESQINQVFFEWGKKYGIACVATNDCHYLNPEDSEAQEVLQCIDLNRRLDFERPKSLVPPEYYVKSADQMFERFANFEGVCEETLRIAEKCKVEFQFKDKEGRPIYHLPDYRPEGIGKEEQFDLVQFFKKAAHEGLEKRFKEPSFREKTKDQRWKEEKQEYLDRLDFELEMIIKTGFAGYFLIVADYVQWAKQNGIPVGPGRGSGAGSLVAYALEIIDIDPIEFKLLFERFINPERISMPDFDVDFCQDRREEVIRYVEKKYGADNVSQIITFGKLQARAVVKDCGRVLGMSFAEMDQITKLFPNELNITVRSAVEKEPRLRELIDQNPKVKTIFDYALKLEGLCRNAGIHAAGVIITEDPIVTYCPLFMSSDRDVVTQFDKDFAEKIGLVKYDFLGLKTLTVIERAVQHVHRSSKSDFNLKEMNLRDSKVFELIGAGDTDGVFQVESSGMKDLCTRLRPNSIEDLTAINALYRPGPLGSGMVDDFIDRKHGRKPIVYELPQLEAILKDTYGVILYQEQVMQISRELAGYSLGQADMLRRAMGKKKVDEMARHRAIFLEGAEKKGIPKGKAETIYDLMAKFAEYGFNKSHSAAYAMITYQTAYLKAHFPAEFMAGLMATEMNNTDKLTKYIQDARAHDLSVLPPDVNRSDRQFNVEESDGKKGIRFGLEAIKGVGSSAVDAILEIREGKDEITEQNLKTGKFSDVIDFCKRVSTRKVNKKVLESLIYAGALDEISEVNRASLLSSVDQLLEFSAQEQEERDLGQTSLFDQFSSDEVKLVTPTTNLLKSEADWPQAKKLAHEKQVVGFYVSGHPMDQWQTICEDWLGWNSDRVKEYGKDNKEKLSAQPIWDSTTGRYKRPGKKEIRMGGIFTEMKEIMTKKGTRMAFAQFEDLSGKMEVIFFPDDYAKWEAALRNSIEVIEPVVLDAEIDIRSAEETVKLIAKAMKEAKTAFHSQAKRVFLKLDPDQVKVDQLRELKLRLLQFRGKCPLIIDFENADYQTRLNLPSDFSVVGTPKLAASVNQIFGKSVVRLM